MADNKAWTLRLSGGLLALLAATGVSAQGPAAPVDQKIDLRLMTRAEADIASGCSVSLWQSNRDPDKDGYVYALSEKLDPKGLRQPARLKLGSEIIQMRRVAVGGKSSGYGLYEHQLYKMTQDSAYAALELKLGPIEGEAVEIESGSMTIILPGRLPFRVLVKGSAGCMTPAAPPPPPQGQAQPRAGAPAAPPPEPASGLFVKYDIKRGDLPARMLKTAEAKFGCLPTVMTSGAVGYQLSEEAAIWQIPCERFAYQASSIFALVYVPDPASQHEFLTFKGPKGRVRPNNAQVLMSPVWNAKTRTVTGVSLGRASGDCGVLERYRLVDSAFVLVEYREKEKCDGARVTPEQFPEIYRAK
jgi:hypothetical protein